MEWFYLTLETVPNNSIIVKQLQENKTIKLECNTKWWSAIYFMRSVNLLIVSLGLTVLLSV